MVDTISALLILIFAVIPGILGNGIYELIIGSNWKEELFSKTVRIVGFSFFGLIFYILIGVQYFNLPVPIYIFPETYTAAQITNSQLIQAAQAWFMNFVVATLIAVIYAFSIKIVFRRFNITHLPDTWDKLVRSKVAEHWVVVNLKGGGSYLGMLESANISVDAKDRDILLLEPARYEPKINNYVAINVQYLFIAGSFISSVGTVPTSTDDRITQIGELIFTQRNGEGAVTNE